MGTEASIPSIQAVAGSAVTPRVANPTKWGSTVHEEAVPAEILDVEKHTMHFRPMDANTHPLRLSTPNLKTSPRFYKWL